MNQMCMYGAQCTFCLLSYTVRYVRVVFEHCLDSLGSTDIDGDEPLMLEFVALDLYNLFFLRIYDLSFCQKVNLWSANIISQSKDLFNVGVHLYSYST